MSPDILERISNSTNLPSMPQVAIRVLELTQREDVSIDEIAAVIEKDPALTVKVLQTANSPLFGLAKKVSRLQQAAVILGLRTVKVMALSFSLVESFRDSGSAAFDYKRYWRRSLTSAVLSKLISQAIGTLRTDECFVGGLLCDIGMLAACRCAPELYAPVVERCAIESDSAPVAEIEREVLGITHAQISSELLGKWALPDMLCDAVAAHHGDGLEELPERTAKLASVLYASSSLADLFAGDVASIELEQVRAKCLELVPIPPEALEQVLDGLKQCVDETASLFKVEIGVSMTYEELRGRAMTQLANISMAAEMERAKADSMARQARQELEELSQKAATDALTRIANRQVFDESIEASVDKAQHTGGSVGLIMIDLDHFKKLNDTHGHQAGDEALRHVGRCLKKLTDEVGMAARYGGEEFAVIVGDATVREIQKLATEICEGIRRISFKHGNSKLRLTASLGAVHINFKLETATSKEIIERADECLYDAKHNGRDRVEITF